jgi:hypothetical protein
MGTKRELRASKNLEAIIKILKPIIDRSQAADQESGETIFSKKLQE